VNKNLLESKMKLHGDTQSDLAEALNISLARCNAKINEYNGAEFTQGEISIMRNRYHLEPQEVDNIFFAPKVS